MPTKTFQIENRLLADIQRGKYPKGSVIPSRNRLAEKFGCSRTIIERVISNLTTGGFLASRKGSGTFVVSLRGMKQRIRYVRLITSDSVFDSWRYSSRMLARRENGRTDIRLIDYVELETAMDELSRPGTAVIWVMPPPQYLSMMLYLKARTIPQLLINRNYLDFDCVYTDAAASLREGLAWLLIESGREIAMISPKCSLKTPYVSERLLAFYEICVEMGAKLRPERLITIEDDPLISIPAAVNALLGTPHPPKGVVLLAQPLAVPLAVSARNMGIIPGRDLRILTFDRIGELEPHSGIGMMEQDYSRFGLEAGRWLDQLQTGGERKPFRIPVKTIFSCPEC